MIEAAAVYLILEFPGQAGTVEVLPMASMELCQAQSSEMVAHYNDDGRAFRLYAHCIESGLAPRWNYRVDPLPAPQTPPSKSEN